MFVLFIQTCEIDIISFKVGFKEIVLLGVVLIIISATMVHQAVVKCRR